jgi:murein DD-endopeptidase MepM/ murein hydrolase activator NlpD
MQIEPATCPVCRRRYDPLRARAVLVVAGKVRAFCSEDCKARSQTHVEVVVGEPDEQPLALPLFRHRRLIGAAVATAAVLIVAGLAFSRRHGADTRAFAAALPGPVAVVEPPPPAAPPSTQDLMGGDVWVHPLLGPQRHLPLRNSRRFGAPREGMRPEECGEGHCGVDIGSDKGAPVMASHDGVVERVERDAELGGRRGNEGRFIRINHRGGRVVTSYIHLDGIRADLKPGMPVKAGEVIGTVGDTGVHSSGPHLHFAVSIRATPEGQELYIDPEPLLHLWPTRDTPLSTLQSMESAPHIQQPALPQKTAKVGSRTQL